VAQERERIMATTKAFVLIETAVGKTKDVVAALHAVNGVSSVDVVTGPYDIITVVEANDLASVGDTVTSSVHTIPGIVRTVTCLAVGTPE
jgi:DNA-binding Lrp family transcriptional regulator